MSKVPFQGRLIAVQPRVRRMRSLDHQRSHECLGYTLLLEGEVARERLGSGSVLPGAHARHRFEAGGNIAGVAEPVVDDRREMVDLYKVSGIRYELVSAVEMFLEVSP